MKLLVGEYDATEMYTSMTWSGSDGQAGRKLEFGLVVSGTDKQLPVVKVMMNVPVQVYNDDGDLFFEGEVVDKSKSIQGNTMQVACIDPLFKANNTPKSYSFEKKTPKDIATKVFGDLKIPTGHLEDGEPLDRIFDMENAYNIVLLAYRLEYEKNKKPFIIRMNGKNAEVVERGKTFSQWELNAKSNLINSTYQESITYSVQTVEIYDKDGKKVGEVQGDIAKPKPKQQVKGRNNQEKVWNFFKGQGFSDAATAGVMGNLMQESSTSINPTLKQSGGGPGRGIAQWTLGSSRWNNLNRYARSKGTQWTDLQTQLEFMVKEMQDGSAYWHKRNVSTKSYADFKQSTSVDQAVMDFERAYERAGKPMYKNRKKYAHQMMQAYGGTGPAAGSRVYRQEEGEDTRARAKAMLKSIEKKANIRAFGDFDLITGNAVIIKEPYTGLSGKFFITADTHSFQDNYHVVELTLAYENLMEEINTAEKKDDEADQNTSPGEGPLPSGGNSNLIQASRKFLGAKYVWGGNSPRATDCSGFVQQAYRAAGINFYKGRFTSAVMRSNWRQMGFQEVPVNQAQPGDIMWHQGHVAMKYDDKNVIEASQSKGRVVIQSAGGRRKRFTKAYRYVGR